MITKMHDFEKPHLTSGVQLKNPDKREVELGVYKSPNHRELSHLSYPD